MGACASKRRGDQGSSGFVSFRPKKISSNLWQDGHSSRPMTPNRRAMPEVAWSDLLSASLKVSANGRAPAPSQLRSACQHLACGTRLALVGRCGPRHFFGGGLFFPCRIEANEIPSLSGLPMLSPILGSAVLYGHFRSFPVISPAREESPRHDRVCSLAPTPHGRLRTAGSPGTESAVRRPPAPRVPRSLR